ncbi:TraB/GumN family protein [Shewanella sp. Isolate11]|uniref:TraB/GumN family protein n=1 Tax=Shewanella sp. Isolate11 TaxID=2908530 RepID=UPI001EFEADB2|nr:TraB/GumN family protein [Shewanella sp. Isolate11]MCG9695523.1 TraB/GumN family protein [Shewanella sp. Isolate11]
MATSRHFSLLVLIGLLSLFAITKVMAAVSDKPPFYKISYQGKSAYLLGSIHVGSEDFYPMAPQIETAFDNASALVIEADIENADVGKLINRYGKTPIAKTEAQDQLTAKRLEGYCQNNITVCNALAGYSPWLQATQLSVMRFGLLGYQPHWGVDQVLIGKNRSRPIIELENAEFQFQLLSSFGGEDQWDMVLEAIEVSDEEMMALINAWRSGDEVAIDQLMVGQLQHGDDIEMLDKILWQRNIDMSHKIAKLMTKQDSDEPLFIVVGAGHVVGDKGIPIKMKSLYQASIQNCWQQKCVD